jgi:hypothetical protein
VPPRPCREDALAGVLLAAAAQVEIETKIQAKLKAVYHIVGLSA